MEDGAADGIHVSVAGWAAAGRDLRAVSLIAGSYPRQGQLKPWLPPPHCRSKPANRAPLLLELVPLNQGPARLSVPSQLNSLHSLGKFVGM